MSQATRLLILAGFTLLLPGPNSTSQARERNPNIIFFIADDLGYGDLSCFGQTKFSTPNLDRLASEGTRLTRHYAGNAVCAPSRCVFMTGLHPGHTPVRDNRETKPEGQYPIPPSTVTIAERLKERGYVSGGFGKWGLGGPGSTGEPLAQGFDRWFGYNCQAVAHNFYPTYLWDNATKYPIRNSPFSAYDKLKPTDDPSQSSTYTRYLGVDYAPDLIAKEALAFVDANKDKPFFLYYPTTVPHLALQVPEDSRKPFEGKFDDTPYLGDRGYLPNQYPRAAYAAMITRMDNEVGKLMAKIRDLGLDNQTLFIFTSDNGPLYDKLGGTDCDFFNSNGGLRGRKGSLYEGGVRVPCIVRWPTVVKAGATSDYISGFEDWVPTILNLALGEQPPAGLDGISIAPMLKGLPDRERPFLYREFPGYGGWQAAWLGNYKILRQNLNPPANPAAKKAQIPAKTELFDLAADPTESKDISAQEPEILRRLETILKSQHVPNEVFPMRRVDSELKGITK